jgi:hypothetical protein
MRFALGAGGIGLKPTHLEKLQAALAQDVQLQSAVDHVAHQVDLFSPGSEGERELQCIAAAAQLGASFQGQDLTAASFALARLATLQSLHAIKDVEISSLQPSLAQIDHARKLAHGGQWEQLLSHIFESQSSPALDAAYDAKLALMEERELLWNILGSPRPEEKDFVSIAEGHLHDLELPVDSAAPPKMDQLSPLMEKRRCLLAGIACGFGYPKDQAHRLADWAIVRSTAVLGLDSEVFQGVHFMDKRFECLGLLFSGRGGDDGREVSVIEQAAWAVQLVVRGKLDEKPEQLPQYLESRAPGFSPLLFATA